MVKTADAYTIIGLKIKEEDLMVGRTYEHKLCCDRINSNFFNYCPSCGSKNKFGTYTISDYIDNYNPNNGIHDEDYRGDFPEDYLSGDCGILTINNTTYKVFKLENIAEMYISVSYTYCIDNYHGYKSNECSLSLENLCELKQKLMEDLCTVDKWKNDVNFVNNFNKNFKIYTISGCS